jgi:cell division protein FtsQ
MHQQKGKKILVYFFLFLIVGSINNTVLTKIRFEKIKNIQISGLKSKSSRKYSSAKFKKYFFS